MQTTGLGSLDMGLNTCTDHTTHRNGGKGMLWLEILVESRRHFIQRHYVTAQSVRLHVVLMLAGGEDLAHACAEAVH